MKYDYLIVGAGLYGAVFAREMTDKGKRCLVIDRRSHTGGNIYCADVSGICVHRYGAHIFHTADEEVWSYVNRFVSFNNYINSPIARVGDEVYNLPFNMNTFSRLWGVCTPGEAIAKIEEQTAPYRDIEPQNLEEQALKLVGPDIYEKLIRAYTEKQWGQPCGSLPAFIIRRLPLRFTYDNNYFMHPHQGIPRENYNSLIVGLLKGIEVLLHTEYSALITRNPGIAQRTVYTGQIDEFFDYRLGPLEYRSLRFEDEVLNCDNWQGCAVVNYTGSKEPFTRIIEHKYFVFGHQNNTVITREYPCAWQPGKDPYYPVNNSSNQAMYLRYKELAEARPDMIFGGRLGEYRYYDMDQVIRAALDESRRQPA